MADQILCALSGHGRCWKFRCLSGSCIVNDTDVQAGNSGHEHVHVIHIYCNARELSPDCFLKYTSIFGRQIEYLD